MIPGMSDVVLILPASQHYEVRVLLLLAFFSTKKMNFLELQLRFREVSHGLDCNKALALFPTLVVVIPRHEIRGRHPDCLELGDPIFKHHNLYRVKFASKVL
jgi:hypothetical protein